MRVWVLPVCGGLCPKGAVWDRGMRVLVMPVCGGLCPKGIRDWVGRTRPSGRRLWLAGARPWGSRGMLRAWALRGVHVDWLRWPKPPTLKIAPRPDFTIFRM